MFIWKKKQIRAQTKKRSIKPNLFSCRSLRFRCDTFAIFCTVSGSLGVFKMLVIAANTCFFINVHLVYRWYSQVFNNVSNTTITWTAFWQLFDKDTTWKFQKFFSFSDINLPHVDAFWHRDTKVYVKKPKFAHMKVHQRRVLQRSSNYLHYADIFRSPKPFFSAAPTPQKQLKPSNWKTACFSNTLQKTHFFWDIPAIRLSDTLFFKHLMTFNNPNLTIYLPWSS